MNLPRNKSTIDYSTAKESVEHVIFLFSLDNCYDIVIGTGLIKFELPLYCICMSVSEDFGDSCLTYVVATVLV